MILQPICQRYLKIGRSLPMALLWLLVRGKVTASGWTVEEAVQSDLKKEQ